MEVASSPGRDTLTIVLSQMTEESCRPHFPTEHMTQGKPNTSLSLDHRMQKKKSTICCHFHPPPPQAMFCTCVSVVSVTSCSLRLLSITPGLGVFACAAPARLLFCRPRAALFSPSRVLRQWCSWPASKISTPFARVEHQTIQIGNKRDSKFDSSIMLFAPHLTPHRQFFYSYF